MPLLSDPDKEAIRGRLREMDKPVKLLVFTQKGVECRYCRETRELIEEVTELSDKLSAEVHLLEERGIADRYGVDKVPAILLLDGEGNDLGVRFFGIPSGYEFATLLEDILIISRGETGLSERTKRALSQLKRDVHIQVFVTPTCPYCPMAASLAHRMAIESNKVRADVVEVSEFPHLAVKYQVRAVPKIVINELLWIEGAVPEGQLLSEVAKAGGIDLSQL